jgi:ribosome-associated protein
MAMRDVAVRGPLPLGSFLKVAGAAATGGHAKLLVQSGEALVNGEPETRRGRTLRPGDVVTVGGQEYRVCSSPP